MKITFLFLEHILILNESAVTILVFWKIHFFRMAWTLRKVVIKTL